MMIYMNYIYDQFLKIRLLRKPRPDCYIFLPTILADYQYNRKYIKKTCNSIDGFSLNKRKTMITLFFMSIPIEKLLDNNKISVSDKEQLLEMLLANIDCDEIKLQMDENGICRMVTKELIPITDDIHYKKLLRQYANQDILIKQRNWKETFVERTKIIKL